MLDYWVFGREGVKKHPSRFHGWVEMLLCRRQSFRRVSAWAGVGLTDFASSRSCSNPLLATTMNCKQLTQSRDPSVENAALDPNPLNLVSMISLSCSCSLSFSGVNVNIQSPCLTSVELISMTGRDGV